MKSIAENRPESQEKKEYDARGLLKDMDSSDFLFGGDDSEKDVSGDGKDLLDDTSLDACGRSVDSSNDGSSGDFGSDGISEFMEGRRDRKWIADLLEENGLEQQASNFRRCGEVKHIIQCDECGYTMEIPRHCKLRICPMCQKMRRMDLIDRYSKALMEAAGANYRFRFVTLTLENSTDLENDKNRIRQAFKELRLEDDYCKDRIKGGFYGIEAKEAKNSPDDDGSVIWNVHLHFVYWGSYMEQEKLSRVWRSITGDSYIVHIEDLGYGLAGARGAVKYMTAYVTKGAEDMWTWSEEAIMEYMRVMENVRLVQGFGDFLGAVGEVEEEEMVCPVCGGRVWNLYDETGTILIAGRGNRGPPADGFEREQSMTDMWVRFNLENSV